MAGSFRDGDGQQDDGVVRRLARSLKDPQRRSLWAINHPTGFVLVVCSVVTIMFGAWLIAAGASLATWLPGVLIGFAAGMAVGVPLSRYYWRRHYPGTSD